MEIREGYLVFAQPLIDDQTSALEWPAAWRARYADGSFVSTASDAIRFVYKDSSAVADSKAPDSPKGIKVEQDQ